MIKTSIEKLSKAIGYDIGTSNNEVQADLINGFCKGLKNSIKDKSNLEMQLCYIANELDQDAEEIMESLYEFINLKKLDK